MSEGVPASDSASAAAEGNLITLPCHGMQIEQLAVAWDAYQATKDRLGLIVGGILASHGIAAGALRSFQGVPEPSVTIELPAPQGG
jgi:hypothetical protein